ncbi:fibrinogen-like protein A [Mercenaria mercenaria]|uniref:fibrinogen-like protein A n=1 Tax=Mercenaria mercenaria TaxID=6596 RepID=UPI00234E3F43|nr:fibrinogen-like protein A [Mercenaria mercenaria]
MVAQGPSELRIDVSSLGGSEGYETFQNFSISPGPGYTLNIALGNGTLGDSPLEGLSYNNNMNFSTFDRDMDMSSANCASYHEAGWCAQLSRMLPHDTIEKDTGRLRDKIGLPGTVFASVSNAQFFPAQGFADTRNYCRNPEPADKSEPSCNTIGPPG